MGMNDRIENARKGKSRGSVNNAGRLAVFAPSPAKQGEADWGKASPQWVADVVSKATLAGVVVSFSLSRDGGAYGLQLYMGGEKAQLWFNGDADLDVELEKVCLNLDTL